MHTSGMDVHRLDALVHVGYMNIQDLHKYHNHHAILRKLNMRFCKTNLVYLTPFTSI